MVHIEDLRHELLVAVPEKYQARLVRAIEIAAQHYSGVIRLSGEPLLNHVLRSAKYYADLRIDYSGIIATLLHHKLPPEVYAENDIFTEDVLYLLKNLDIVFSKARGESVDTQVIYKYILSFDDDLRVALIKLSEKFDNAKTIDFLPTEKKLDVARRLLSIYSPLAEYMNLSDAKNRFDADGFRVYHPKEFDLVSTYIHENQRDIFENIKDLQHLIEEVLEIVRVRGAVWGRVKSYYSIWRKMAKYAGEGKPSDIGRFRDLIAFTIMVDSAEQCYAVAYALQQYADAKTVVFEDYILHPKPNGFSEIQLNCAFPELPHRVIEIQIMTRDMYWHNTYGPASHIAYKLAGTRLSKATTEYQWVEKLHQEIAQLQKTENLEESRPLKMHLFTDKIFTFTPKNRIIELPVGSTALDFAYQVHTKIGDAAIFAKINGGKNVSLGTVLSNGDVVEIITDSKKQFPSDEALQLVTTHSAIEKVRRGLRKKLLQ